MTNTTQTTEQVSEAFRAEFQALLDKYGATVDASDHFSGYPECGEDIYIEVTIPSIYDDQGNKVRPFTEINLGRYLTPTEVNKA